MKLIVEVADKNNLSFEYADGIILPLKDYSVESIAYYTLDEIQDFSKSYSKEIFVKMNRNMMNQDIESVCSILKELDHMNITGILFYDLAILEIKKELQLSIDLVWNQTHMVHNTKTCDYYYSKGVRYALLGKELTLEEIMKIIQNSKITSMVEVVGRPSIAFSKRKLLTNYGMDLGRDVSLEEVIEEKVTKKKIRVKENQNGTSFFLDAVTNGTGVISDLYQVGCPYIIMKEYGIEDCFQELVIDTMNYIHGGCIDSSYVKKYQKLGSFTNFFFQKTIYKVK